MRESACPVEVVPPATEEYNVVIDHRADREHEAAR
jgi:hypothetical protein